MITSLWKGFNFFGKKDFFKIFIAYLFYGVASFFLLNYIDVTLSNINLAEINSINSINYTQYIINALGLDLVWVIASIFVLIITYALLTITVANTESKKKISFLKKLRLSFRYSFLFILLFMVFFIIMSILGSMINIFTIILLVLLLFATIMVFFMFHIGNIFLGLYDITIKEALEKGKDFFKKKFFTTVVFIILLMIVSEVIYFIFDKLYHTIFFFDSLAATITVLVSGFISATYIINALTLFVKSKKFV